MDSSTAPFSSVLDLQMCSQSSRPSPSGMDGEGSEGEVVAMSEVEEEGPSMVEVDGGGTTEVRRRIVSDAESSVMLRRRGVGFSSVAQ